MGGAVCKRALALELPTRRSPLATRRPFRERAPDVLLRVTGASREWQTRRSEWPLVDGGKSLCPKRVRPAPARDIGPPGSSDPNERSRRGSIDCWSCSGESSELPRSESTLEMTARPSASREGRACT